MDRLFFWAIFIIALYILDYLFGRTLFRLISRSGRPEADTVIDSRGFLVNQSAKVKFWWSVFLTISFELIVLQGGNVNGFFELLFTVGEFLESWAILLAMKYVRTPVQKVANSLSNFFKKLDSDKDPEKTMDDAVKSFREKMGSFGTKAKRPFILLSQRGASKKVNSEAHPDTVEDGTKEVTPTISADEARKNLDKLANRKRR